MDPSAIVAIVLIDLALSGDNALLIGMAARRLPAVQRRRAIVLGGALAVILRFVAAAIVTFLLAIPYLQLAGGTCSRSSRTVSCGPARRTAPRPCRRPAACARR